MIFLFYLLLFSFSFFFAILTFFLTTSAPSLRKRLFLIRMDFNLDISSEVPYKKDARSHIYQRKKLFFPWIGLLNGRTICADSTSPPCSLVPPDTYLYTLPYPFPSLPPCTYPQTEILRTLQYPRPVQEMYSSRNSLQMWQPE